MTDQSLRILLKLAKIGFKSLYDGNIQGLVKFGGFEQVRCQQAIQELEEEILAR